jgi:hypothetical protein
MTGRRGVNGVERCDERRVKSKSVRLDERKRIMRLRFDVNANDIESRSGIADASPAGTTEKIERRGLLAEA